MGTSDDLLICVNVLDGVADADLGDFVQIGDNSTRAKRTLLAFKVAVVASSKSVKPSKSVKRNEQWGVRRVVRFLNCGRTRVKNS